MPKVSEGEVAFVRRAIELACTAVGDGHHPFAAVLVSSQGQVLFEGTNLVAKSGDPIDHAEVNTLRSAYRMHGLGSIIGAALYVSGEPCTMCAGMIVRFGISRVVFAAPESVLISLWKPTAGFKSYPSAKVFQAAGSAIEVIGGVLIEESKKPFELYHSQLTAREPTRTS